MGSVKNTDTIAALQAELKIRAPKLLSLVLPRDFPYTTLASLCSTGKQRKRLQKLMDTKLEACSMEEPTVVLRYEVDVANAKVEITKAEIVTAAEACAPSLLRRLSDDEILTQLDGLLLVRDIEPRAAQELLNMAFSLRVLANNLPGLAASAKGHSLPLEASVSVEELVEQLLLGAGVQEEGSAKKKRRKSMKA